MKVNSMRLVLATTVLAIVLSHRVELRILKLTFRSKRFRPRSHIVRRATAFRGKAFMDLFRSHVSQGSSLSTLKIN